MKIIVNGQEYHYDKQITLQQLIQDLKIVNKVMASAINMEIVKKDKWDKTILKDGDKIELLQFVGGG
jgi:sulfur carrier protein